MDDDGRDWWTWLREVLRKWWIAILAVLGLLVVGTIVAVSVGGGDGGGSGSGASIKGGRLSMPPQELARYVNCDCPNTQAPDIGGAATRQCAANEAKLRQLAADDKLTIQVRNEKIVGPAEHMCDLVAAGPAAWPYRDKPADPAKARARAP